MRVLIVESDPSLSGSMKTLVERSGHQTDECIGGKDALGAFRSSLYDLAVKE